MYLRAPTLLRGGRGVRGRGHEPDAASLAKQLFHMENSEEPVVPSGNRLTALTLRVMAAGTGNQFPKNCDLFARLPTTLLHIAQCFPRKPKSPFHRSHPARIAAVGSHALSRHAFDKGRRQCVPHAQ
jgi:hypothetical protein